MGNLKTVRVISAEQLVTQQEQDRVAGSLKSQLCSEDAVCADAVDAAVKEALPLQHAAVDPYFGLPTGETVDTTALAVVETAVQNGGGANWAYTVVAKEKIRTDASYAGDGTVDRYCQGTKSTYATGLKATYGGRTAWAPLYTYVEKVPYRCYTDEEIQQLLSGY